MQTTKKKEKKKKTEFLNSHLKKEVLPLFLVTRRKGQIKEMNGRDALFLNRQPFNREPNQASKSR